MSKLIKGALLLLLLLSQRVDAQNYYNSPYTRFNLGDLINTGFAYNRAMGGTSMALRANNHINYLNPASYTAQDTMSFLFQVGFTSRIAKIQTSQGSDKSSNSNIEYLSIGIPIKRWLNLSAGVVPYSRTGYNVLQYWPENSLGIETAIENKGSGGLNEFYFGGALTIKKVLSLGANFNYLFGSLDRETESYVTGSTTFNSIEVSNKDRSASIVETSNHVISGFYTKLGMQYHPTINEKHSVIVGATFDVNTKVKVKLQDRTLRYSTVNDRSQFIDTFNIELDTLPNMLIPYKVGVGVSYKYNNKWLITAEYSQQDWTNAGTEIVGSTYKNGLYQSYRLGAEYTPVSLKERLRTSYFKRVQYRLGGYYTKTPIYYGSTNISDWGLSVGLGLPLKNARKMFTGSSFNIGYQFGQKGTFKEDLVKEQYHIITFGITLHDFWFLKPKYD